jgi:hypothetical protein
MLWTHSIWVNSNNEHIPYVGWSLVASQNPKWAPGGCFQHILVRMLPSTRIWHKYLDWIVNPKWLPGKQCTSYTKEICAIKKNHLWIFLFVCSSSNDVTMQIHFVIVLVSSFRKDGGNDKFSVTRVYICSHWMTKQPNCYNAAYPLPSKTIITCKSTSLLCYFTI